MLEGRRCYQLGSNLWLLGVQPVSSNCWSRTKTQRNNSCRAKKLMKIYALEAGEPVRASSPNHPAATGHS